MPAEVQQERPTVEFVPIECDYLDGENVAWAKRYVEDCRQRLEAAEADPPYAQYLRVEIAAYEELIQRFQKPGA